MTAQSILFAFSESRVRLWLASSGAPVVGVLLEADHTGLLLDEETTGLIFYPWGTVHRVELIDARRGATEGRDG